VEHGKASCDSHIVTKSMTLVTYQSYHTHKVIVTVTTYDEVDT